MFKDDVFIRKFKAPAYNTKVWIVVAGSVSKGIDVVEDMVDHSIIADKDRRSTKAYMYAYEDYKGRYQMMCFYRYNAKPGEIAHEAKHILNTLFLWHGVSLSLSNDEHECYYLEWLVDRIHNTIKQYKRIRK
jgi:hypothetical protein